MREEAGGMLDPKQEFGYVRIRIEDSAGSLDREEYVMAIRQQTARALDDVIKWSMARRDYLREKP